MITKEQKQNIFEKVFDFLLLRQYEPGEINLANELFNSWQVIHITGVPIDIVILHNSEENIILQPSTSPVSFLFRIWPKNNKINTLKYFYKAWKQKAIVNHVHFTWNEVYAFLNSELSTG